jgi:Domain of unknown function (DUF932)
MDAVERSRGAFLEKAAWWDVDGSHVINARVPGADFLKLAKMDYTVVKEQVERNLGGIQVAVPNQFHIVRGDDQRVVSPSTVTSQYVTRQPSDAVEIVDDIVQAGLGVYDAGFTLYGGQSEVVTVRLCDIEEAVVCDGSKWNTFLVIQNYHGTGKMRGKIVRLRVVCHNTVTAGFAGGADWAFTHKKSIKEKQAGIPKMWMQAADAVKEHCRRLAMLDKPVNVPETIDELLAIEDDATTQQKNRRDAIVAAANMPSMGTNGRTLYDIFNAVTYYTTHNAGGKSGKTAGGRIESILDGTRGDFEAEMAGKLFALAGVPV